MNVNTLLKEIEEFSKEPHGSSNYDKEELFVAGSSPGEFAPLKYLIKKIDKLESFSDLLREGFVVDSYELLGFEKFQDWYERQFSKKLMRRVAKKVAIIHHPDNKRIFDAIEAVHKNYQILKDQQVLLNSKNLPVQLGEWYAKCIFGLKQAKSASQRGFDFYLNDKRVEVKVHWADQSSPKGVKIRKSLVELSDFCAIIYMAKNFMIREVCFLDSEFVLRKFSGKGHTIFLKDQDVSQYFFSRSTKQMGKVVNSSALLKYASPTLAMKIAEYFS